MAINRDWWKDAEDDASVELRSEAALRRSLDEKANRVRQKLSDEKKRIKSQRNQPVRVDKMHSSSYWAEMLGFAPKTIVEWARSGELKGYWIKGQWRIPESSVQEFLKKQQETYAS